MGNNPALQPCKYCEKKLKVFYVNSIQRNKNAGRKDFYGFYKNDLVTSDRMQY